MRVCLSLHSSKSVSLCTTLLVGEVVGGNCGSTSNNQHLEKRCSFFSQLKCCMLYVVP